MRLGYAQSIINPTFEQPIFLAGFGQNRLAKSVHDDLYARALTLSDGKTTIVLCALDLIGFFQNDVREVIERLKVIRPDAQIILASTHTHHGPDTMGLWGPNDRIRGVDQDYLVELKEIIIQTISDSLELADVTDTLKTASLRVPGVAKNARDPDIVDDELTALQFLTADNRPLVTLMNFACHPEVLWENNPQITSDYPGFLRQVVESETGSPCIFFSGALGGMMTPDVVDHSFDEAQTMGEALAKNGLAKLEDTPIQKIERQLRFVKQPFSAKLQNPLFKIAIRRGLLPEPRKQRGTVNTEINLIQIEDCWLVTVPGELFPKLGLSIKDKLHGMGAFVTGVIGLTNDELGYILPGEDYRFPLNPFNPKNHYEETMSISKEIGINLMEAVDELLKTVF